MILFNCCLFNVIIICNLRITGDRYIGSLFRVDEPVPMILILNNYSTNNFEYSDIFIS